MVELELFQARSDRILRDITRVLDGEADDGLFVRLGMRDRVDASDAGAWHKRQLHQPEYVAADSVIPPHPDISGYRPGAQGSPLDVLPDLHDATGTKGYVREDVRVGDGTLRWWGVKFQPVRFDLPADWPLVIGPHLLTRSWDDRDDDGSSGTKCLADFSGEVALHRHLAMILGAYRSPIAKLDQDLATLETWVNAQIDVIKALRENRACAHLCEDAVVELEELEASVVQLREVADYWWELLIVSSAIRGQDM
jgi:hypothetical protein